MPEMQILERVIRQAPFGLRFWDVATEIDLIGDLEVDVGLRNDPDSFVRAVVNRRGIYTAAGLPGLRDFELSDTDAAHWAAAMRRYRVQIGDPEGRYLPLAFDADLPARGLFNWLTPWTSPPQPFALPTEHGSPPPLMWQRVPLFSAPSRLVPGSLAVVRAQLVELGSERPAAWSILTVSIDGAVRGIGLADAKGRVAVLFPYPDRPRPTLTSPPQATNDFRWNVELTAYYVPRPPGVPVPEVADLGDVLAQMSSPQTLFQSVASPVQALPAMPLEFRIPLTVRTEITANGPSSFLFVNAA